MTKHTGAPHTGDGSVVRPRRPPAGGDREVSERIYDYITSGHADQRDRRGAHPSLPSAGTL